MILDADVIKWLLAVVVGAMGWWLRGIDKRLTTLEAESTGQIQRLTTLEAHYVDILNRLSRIEDKLDALKP